MKALSTLIPAAVMLAVWASAAENANDLFQKALQKERGDGNPAEAIRMYQRIVDKYASNRAVAAKALERIGQCHEKLGNAEARKAYERLVREFGDQKDPAATARTRLAALGKPAAPSGISVRRVFEDLPGDPSAVSPDGRYVLHYEDRTPSNYMVRDLATGKSRRLTSYVKSSGHLSWDPLFSPDSRRIAYAAWPGEDNELHVVGVDGAGDRVVWRFNEYFELRGWFPDGSRVAVLAWPHGKEGMKLLAVSLADGAVKVLKEADAKTKGGWLSPDGKYSVFVKETSKDPLQNDIWCLSLESGRETPLVVYPADNRSPRWTPDGKGIFFSSDRRGTLGIWHLAVSAGKPAGPAELIKGDTGETFWPIGLTHDGTVYYESKLALANSLMAEFDRAAGRIVSGPSEVAPKSSGRTQNAAFSADGKQLAYYRKKGFDNGRYTLILRSLATGEEREIATQFKAVHAQQWFPDGRSLLVYAVEPEISGGRYYRLDIATGKSTPLVRSRTTFHALSRDGKTLYFVRGEPSEIYTAEVDFATGKVLAQPARVTNRFWGANMGPSWSPDGQYLAYHSWRSSRWRVPGNLTIVIKSAKTGEERDLLVKLYQYAPVRWFPDGKSFLVSGAAEQDSSRPHSFYRVNAETGEVSLIKTVTEPGQTAGALSPDGKAIFYVLRETDTAFRIMVYQIDTKEERELFRSVPPQSIEREWPLPSPDGRQLAFVLRDTVTNTVAIKVMPARGGKPRELAGGWRTQDVDWVVIAGWSPDGRYLYFATTGQSAGLWRVSTDGGAPQKFEVNIKGLLFPSLHPDGRHISFSAELDPAYALSARNLETGEEHVLLQGDNVSMYPAVSPDGRQLALARIQGRDSLIEILPLGGGKQREILKLPAAEALLGHPAFSPDGREIFFSRRAPKGERIELWRVSAQGGTPFKTDVWVPQPREQAQDWDKGRIVPPPTDYSAQQFRGLAFHPDGRRFVFDTGLQRVEFWAMENFLPKAAK